MSNWKLNPYDLIGKRIEIEWANGRRHRGTVTRYNQFQYKHTIQYDDTDINDYDMYTRRFWIIGGSEEGFHPSPRPLSESTTTTNVNTTANYGGTGGYSYPAGYTAYQWVPYVSRTPDASTLVTFHVVIDAKVTNVRSVRITGNLEVMSAFTDGIPMVIEDGNQCVWTISLHLPFTLTDYHINGMFQFHYEIVMTDGAIIPEGQGERTEQKLRHHFFHAFRPDYRVPAFRYTTAMPPKTWFQSFIVAQKTMLKTGTVSLYDAVGMFSELFDCCVGAARVHVEECFEDEIDIVEDTV